MKRPDGGLHRQNTAHGCVGGLARLENRIPIFKCFDYISAQAIEPRESVQRPRLTFSGTTAFCSVNCLGDKDSDQVEATLTLYQGTTYVDSWSGSGKGYVSLSGSCGVTSGKSYKLVLTYSINGSSKPSVATAATCP